MRTCCMMLLMSNVTASAQSDIRDTLQCAGVTPAGHDLANAEIVVPFTVVVHVMQPRIRLAELLCLLHTQPVVSLPQFTARRNFAWHRRLRNAVRGAPRGYRCARGVRVIVVIDRKDVDTVIVRVRICGGRSGRSVCGSWGDCTGRRLCCGLSTSACLQPCRTSVLVQARRAVHVQGCKRQALDQHNSLQCCTLVSVSMRTFDRVQAKAAARAMQDSRQGQDEAQRQAT